MSSRRLTVLISGRGSNLQALHHAIQHGRLHAQIALVLSNRADAGGLAWAREQGLPVEVLPSKGVDRASYDRQLIERIDASQPSLVVLAGFMRLLTPALIDHYPGRIVNIHPSLLPAFPGLHAQRQALDYGVKFAGCTVHFVTADMDAGPIIAQAAVPVLDDDDEDTLAARILAEEHRLFAEAIGQVLDGRYRCLGRRVLMA